MKRITRLFKSKFVWIIITSMMALIGNAQTDSAKAAASTYFKDNNSRHFWMGTNYRKEWLTPVTAPVINLSTAMGGLTPVKKGGGKQTKSLRVEDPSGKQYTFRSIQKFITAKTLPADLQSEAAEDLVADGVSASYPYSTLSIPAFNDAAGIPYNKVKLVYIGDDPKLGEFREEFKNALYLFEEKLPDGIDKDYDTEEVVEKLEDDNDNTVDQLSLLKIRILDMFVMDFDRHEGQWTWGARENENGKGKTYFPIAKDRDQAFYINQGVVPGIAKWPWIVPQLEGLKAKAKNINRFNFAARNFDRFFLNELNEQDWKKAVDEFIPKMTDQVIETALNQQPREIREFSTDKIIAKLKARRKYLADEVMQYYRFLAEIVSVSGSDKKELYDVTRNDDGTLQLKVYKITKEGEQSILMYDRTFDPKDTKEIRVYGFGGDDQFVVKGSEDKIKIRFIGGKGEDSFEYDGPGNGGIVYDKKSGDNKISGDFKNKMANDTIVNSYNRLGYKYNQTIPFVSVTYNSDDGLYLGASVKFISHGFRKEPYKSMHLISSNHAVATKAYNFHYYAEYIGVFGRKTDLLTDADIQGPEINNFFGYGTSSVFDKTKPGKHRYYRTRYFLGDFSAGLRTRFSDKVSIIYGPTLQLYNLDSADNVDHFIDTHPAGVDPSTLYSKQSYFGGRFYLIADTRNNKTLPTKGIIWQTSLRHLSGLNDKSYTLTQLNSEFTFLLPITKNTLIFSNRTGGGHNFGDYEFYQAQYLGNDDNLRGYRKYRFAGRSKVFNNSELRWRLATFRTYLFPAHFGLLAFYDTGTVWDDNNSNNKWLSGYGGGIWIAPLSRIVITASYAASKEDNAVLVEVGWRF